MEFLKFLIKHHFLFLFVFLETIAFILVVNANNRKHTLFLHSANQITGQIDEWASNTSRYFNLSYENDQLRKENKRLRDLALENYTLNRPSYSIIDTSFKQHFLYHEAVIAKNTVHLRNNYLIINKGSKQGIEPDMAVIGVDGVVGLITQVKKHYSLAISLLNTRFSISARLKENDYFGTLAWKGVDYRYAYLNDIPNHISIEKGDTVSTTGYSAFFPENTPIGTVESYSLQEGQNFYTIKVKLSTDFKQIRNVYLVKNRFKEEQLELLEEINE